MDKESLIKRLNEIIKTCKLVKNDLNIRDEYSGGYYDGSLILAEEILEYLKS
jgi:hypothetical protein